MIALLVLAAVASYLIGSISFAVIFTKLFSNTDVREHGSGNAGTTNVMRVAGKKAGILTFLCDALKGAAAVLLGWLVFKYVYPGNEVYVVYGKYICGVACMLGHAFPLWFGFKGGKCAATCVGIFGVACPIATGIGLAVYAVVMIITRIVSISTLSATVVVVVFSVWLNGVENYGTNYAIIGLSLLAGAIVFIRHKENIKRLLKGEEKKLKVKK